MIGPAADDGGAVQEGHRHGAGRWLNLSCLGVGVVSVVYCVYDLARPGHFVGDMYGLEVVARLVWLVLLVGIFLAGLLMATLEGSGRSPRVYLLGRMLLAGSTIGLLLTAIGVVHSRWLDAVRATYPLRSTAELLRIAKEKKDQFAIDELLVRKDPGSAAGLRAILLDETERPALRECAAHALGEIGTQEARAALETARKTAPTGALRTAIDYALNTRMR